MPWYVWEDANADEKMVYALYTRDGAGRHDGGMTRMYQLRPGGSISEVSEHSLPPDVGKPADPITQLGAVCDVGGLARGANRMVTFEGSVYALTTREGQAAELWRMTFLDLTASDSGDHAQEWERVLTWPKGLVRLADDSLGVLHPDALL